MNSHKSQGEIFGIALFFVILIVGIVIYGQIKVLNPDDDKNVVVENKFKIIAEGTLNSVMKLSTGCFVERNRDSVQDMINYCLENSFSGVDPEIECDDGSGGVVTYEACDRARSLLSITLDNLFIDENVGAIPYVFTLNVSREESILNKYSDQITNFDDDIYGLGSVLDAPTLRKLQFSKVSSGLKTWPTAQGNVEVELVLYYQ